VSGIRPSAGVGGQVHAMMESIVERPGEVCTVPYIGLVVPGRRPCGSLGSSSRGEAFHILEITDLIIQAGFS